MRLKRDRAKFLSLRQDTQSRQSVSYSVCKMMAPTPHSANVCLHSEAPLLQSLKSSKMVDLFLLREIIVLHREERPASLSQADSSSFYNDGCAFFMHKYCRVLTKIALKCMFRCKLYDSSVFNADCTSLKMLHISHR